MLYKRSKRVTQCWCHFLINTFFLLDPKVGNVILELPIRTVKFSSQMCVCVCIVCEEQKEALSRVMKH